MHQLHGFKLVNHLHVLDFALASFDPLDDLTGVSSVCNGVHALVHRSVRANAQLFDKTILVDHPVLALRQESRQLRGRLLHVDVAPLVRG